jgi:hypothetical protein
MTGELYDSPVHILVHSESEGDKASYLVDLCGYDVNRYNPTVGALYNGGCQCKDFLYRCLPKLKDPFNDKVFRCKHIRWARENCLDFILPYLAKSDPNHQDE